MEKTLKITNNKISHRGHRGAQRKKQIQFSEFSVLSVAEIQIPITFKLSNTKLISLTQGKSAIVDAEDYNWLSQYKWCAAKDREMFYAHRGNGGTTVSMHRQIMRAPKGVMCDHRNHNGLDNRKSNLRLCTSAQNQYNKRPKKGCASRYKGVVWRRDCKKWRAKIGFKRKRIHIGDFTNEMDAAMAYDDKAVELFGEFAYLNFPERVELRNWIRKIIWVA